MADKYVIRALGLQALKGKNMKTELYIKNERGDLAVLRTEENTFKIRFQVQGGFGDGTYWEQHEKTYPNLTEAMKSVVECIQCNIESDFYCE